MVAVAAADALGPAEKRADGVDLDVERLRIRRYQPVDLGALYYVCLNTGDSGEDATAMYMDSLLLGHVYAGPYGVLEPESAFVLEDRADLDDEGDPAVVGYCLGAFDTAAFNRRVRTDWLPPLLERYPEPTGERAGWTRDERIMWLLHHPEVAFPVTLQEALTDYPSHLHIDLLPSAQGSGRGRALIEALLAVFRRRGSRGVHLGVGTRNERAQGFYHHLGFHDILREDSGAIIMGLRFD